LVRELGEIAELLGLDYGDIKSYDREQRTVRLEMIKDLLVRAEVVSKYTLINESLDSIISEYYFGPFTQKKGFMYYWRTKKFQRFNFYILERLSILQKLDLVKDVTKMPANIANNIAAINDLRNALAHAFFPENLRRYRPSKPVYKGKNIFSLEGLERFLEDCEAIWDWYYRRLGHKT